MVEGKSTAFVISAELTMLSCHWIIIVGGKPTQFNLNLNIQKQMDLLRFLYLDVGV